MFFVPWKDRKQSGHFGTASVVLAPWPQKRYRFLPVGQWFEVILASSCPLERAGKVALAQCCRRWGWEFGKLYPTSLLLSSWKLMADQLFPQHFWPRWLSLQPLPTYLYINVMRENTKDTKYHHYIIPALYPKPLATVLAWDFQSVLLPPCESSQTSTLVLLCLCCPRSWVDKVSAQATRELFTITIQT